MIKCQWILRRRVKNGRKPKRINRCNLRFIWLVYTRKGLLAIEDFPAKFRYVIFLKKPPYEVQIIETWRTAGDILDLFGLIGDCWQAIQNQVFLPTAKFASNWKCDERYCDFWDICKYGGNNA